MPKITNKKTGKSKTVTEEGLKAIQENPLLAGLHTYSKTEQPAEVTEMKDQEAPSKGAASKAAASKGGSN